MNGIRAALLVTAVLASSVAQPASIPTYTDKDIGEFHREWLLCGPFPNPPTPQGARNVPTLPGMNADYLQAHGGEAKLKAKAGQVEKFDGGQAEWIRHTSRDVSILLDEVIAPKNDVLAYALCRVRLRSAGRYLLALGSDDSARVFVNGEEAWANFAGRGLQVDEDIVPVELKKGTNTILLKVENGMGGWGFSFRLLPFSLETLGSQRHFSSQRTPGGGLTIKTDTSGYYLDRLLRKVDFRLKDGETVLWRGSWPWDSPLVIPAPSEHYKQYTLETERYFLHGESDSYAVPVLLGPIKRYTLFEDGKTQYKIVIGAGASDSERWAAQELRYWLREASGADFPVFEDTAPIAEHEIILGVNEHTRKVLGEKTPNPAELDESFHILNTGPKITITGGRMRGTMYGVMDFLETELGCRWYTPHVSVIPKKNRYAFVTLDRTGAPGLRVRNDFYYEAFEPIWAARNRINGSMGYRVQPGDVESYWAVHTFNHFMPPDEFFESHPEYYSLIGGARSADRTQLCLTNPDVFRILTERLKNSCANIRNISSIPCRRMTGAIHASARIAKPSPSGKSARPDRCWIS